VPAVTHDTRPPAEPAPDPLTVPPMATFPPLSARAQPGPPADLTV
jgi:hypothetical protein